MERRNGGASSTSSSPNLFGWTSSGPAATLWIVNDTHKPVKFKKLSSYHMPGWKFHDVPARSCASFRIMFAEGWFKFETSDKGTVVFDVLDSTFSILASWGPFPRLSVDWSEVNEDVVTVFPPTNMENGTCDLGWSQDGTMCILVQDKVPSLASEEEATELTDASATLLARDAHGTPVIGGFAEPSEEFNSLLASPRLGSSLTQRCKRLFGSCYTKPASYPTMQFSTQDAKKIFAALSPNDEDSITDEDASKFALALACKERTPMPVGNWESNWMKKYADIIGGLTLEKMSLPCSHDSGTYSGISPFAQKYAKTQGLPIFTQLNLGIRVLDLRIGQYSPGNYIISHDIWRTEYSLAKALKEVTDFVAMTDKEIVVLDFHRFNVLMWKDMGFDFKSLKVQIKAALEAHYIPAFVGRGKTLNEIWASSGGRRVIVSWNGPDPDEYMWPRVDQHWYKDVKTLPDLSQAISDDIAMKETQDGFWSMCVFRSVDFDHTPHSNAKEACSTIEGWFFGCSTWTWAANIITVDFFYEFSNVVQACVCANLLKGRHDVPLISPVDDGWVIVDACDAVCDDELDHH